MQVKENVPLAQHTTFKIGGPARFFVEAKTVDELKEAVAWAKKQGQNIFVVGGGSNVLFSDKGFNGLVIQLRVSELRVEGDKLIAGAGVTVEQALDTAIEHGLAGLEWAGGLPGTIGGGVRGNAGAFGGELKDVVEKVVATDHAGNLKTYTKKQCQFGYRDSVFKHNNEVVVEVTLRLTPGVKQTLRAIADDHIQYRKDRHPLEFGNAGSMFKNTPVQNVSKDLQEKWKNAIKIDPFPVVPTAKIIADAGLAGLQVGKAQVSTKHTNYIVNLGGATAEDVKKLIKKVQEAVKQKFNIALEIEVQIV